MIVVALGANLPSSAGPPRATLKAALTRLRHFGIQPKRVSRLYASRALGAHAGPDFVNAVALVETALKPQALLHILHLIEAQFGRRRIYSRRFGPRTLDLDLIAYDDIIENGRAPKGGGGFKPFHLPHAEMALRAFVLKPLAEIAPAWRHPENGLSAYALWGALSPKHRRDVWLKKTVKAGDRGLKRGKARKRF